MKLKFDAPTEDTRIEIIPLIDVIFCILTFFILAALQLTRQQAISLNLPQARTSTPQAQEARLLVAVDAFGQTYIDDQRVSLTQLYQALQRYQQINPSGQMVLYAARETSYNDVVRVLDLLRSVGGDRVALATLQPSGNQAPANPGFPLPNGSLAPNGSNGLPGGLNNGGAGTYQFPTQPGPGAPGGASDNPLLDLPPAGGAQQLPAEQAPAGSSGN
ncbi:biopolymer transporter ExbD [Geitlerinema sp. PCC 7407]|uniref:ExbD/TolR family protein n=1 Tax=Geitlerinema sp. PCC 7407 TaxID=1173025 RepID=UPI00029F81EF|nr:biopolymer transporter ExbD [Geitlerinema sp. PCC 7407]AFY64607.1 Biopolymer transport protein ExbD/TolR [Geitlerinema sp. PCC 7407]